MSPVIPVMFLFSKRKVLDHIFHFILITPTSFNLNASVCLLFMTLTIFFKGLDQIFCRVSLSVSFSDVSSDHIQFSLGRNTSDVMLYVFFSASYQELHDIDVPISVYVTFDYLVKIVFVRFSTLKLQLFLYVINRYFGGRYFEIM